MVSKSSFLIYITVNRNGFMTIWHDEPIKNEKTGKWEGKMPVANSIIYKDFTNMIKESNICWTNEPIVFDIKI